LIPESTVAEISEKITRDLYEKARMVGIDRHGGDMAALRNEIREGMEHHVRMPERGHRADEPDGS
jgi:hypothetical protein